MKIRKWKLKKLGTYVRMEMEMENQRILMTYHRSYTVRDALLEAW